MSRKKKQLLYKSQMLRKIVLSSFLSSFSIVLNIIFKKHLPINLWMRSISPSFQIISYTPIVIMSFYVPFYFSFTASFFAETVGYFVITQKSFMYEPMFSFIIAFCFGILTKTINKKDSFFIFYIKLAIINLFYRFLYFIAVWIMLQKLKHSITYLDILSSFNVIIDNFKISNFISFMLSEKNKPLLPIILFINLLSSFILTLIIKKILQRIHLTENYNFKSK